MSAPGADAIIAYGPSPGWRTLPARLAHVACARLSARYLCG